jgi:hypothetical protein
MDSFPGGKTYFQGINALFSGLMSVLCGLLHPDRRYCISGGLFVWTGLFRKARNHCHAFLNGSSGMALRVRRHGILGFLLYKLLS